MADDSSPTESARAQLREFRRIIANAFGELRSQQVRDTYAAISLSEVINQHLAQLTGDGSVPSRKQRMTLVHDQLVANIEAIKDTNPDAFRTHDPTNDVNTAP